MLNSGKFLKAASTMLVASSLAVILPSSGLAFADSGSCGSSSNSNTAAIAVGVAVVGVGVASASGAGIFGAPTKKKSKAEDKKPGDASISPFVEQNGAPALPTGASTP